MGRDLNFFLIEHVDVIIKFDKHAYILVSSSK